MRPPQASSSVSCHCLSSRALCDGLSVLAFVNDADGPNPSSDDQDGGLPSRRRTLSLTFPTMVDVLCWARRPGGGNSASLRLREIKARGPSLLSAAKRLISQTAIPRRARLGLAPEMSDLSYSVPSLFRCGFLDAPEACLGRLQTPGGRSNGYLQQIRYRRIMLTYE